MRLCIYQPFALLVLLLVTASCENELPFNIKDNPPKLVMNALINADNPSNVLYLTFTGKEEATYAENATVEIRVNGQLSESLRPSPGEGSAKSCFNISSKFAPGDVVRIDAFTDDGQHHAWAEATVPQRPHEITGIDTVTVPLTQYNYMQDYLQYKIGIKDRSGEDNFYRLVIDKQTVIEEQDPETGERTTRVIHNYQFISREDIVLTDGQPTNSDDEDNGMFDTVQNIYGIFNDSRFKDTAYTMTVYNRTNMDWWLPEYSRLVKIDIVVRLLSITETEFYYLKALNLVDSDAYDETINEPVKYPGNVHGGTGIVGISTEVSKIIHIEHPQQ